MSGWNSSRPSWDPQGGAGENTQAYSVPDSSAGIDDDWPEPGVSLAGLGYGERRQPDDLQAGRRPPRHRAGGLPQDARPAGPPPDIFQQDPGYPATAQRDYGQPGNGRHATCHTPVVQLVEPYPQLKARNAHAHCS